MTDKIQDLMNEAEDVLFQKIIDRQEGAQGMAERDLPGPSPTQADLKKWENALDELARQTAPPRKRGRLRRTVILAALLGAALIIAAAAFHTQVLNWVETVYEQFTHIQVGNAAQDEVDSWPDIYLPTYLPPHFTMTDATNAEDVKIIEYTNTEGVRITFYQYSAKSSVRIDTEAADQSITTLTTGQEAYIYHKGPLSTLYWNIGASVFSLEFESAMIQEAELCAFAGSIQLRQ